MNEFRMICAAMALASLPLAAGAGETPFLGIAGEQAIEDERTGEAYERVNRELDAAGVDRPQRDPADPVAPGVRDAETAQGRVGESAFWPSTIHQNRRTRETEGAGLHVLTPIFGN